MGKYRMRPGRLLPALVITFGVAGLLLWGLWGALAWAKTAVLQQVLEVKFLARDEITVTVPVSGLLIKNEVPVKSPAAGELLLRVQDGERLRAGTPLAEIAGPGSAVVHSPGAGVFCTHVDGLESLLIPESAEELDLVAVEALKPAVSPTAGRVDSGQFLGKVVDNLQPVYLWVQTGEPVAGQGRVFTPGGSARLLYNGREITGRIKTVRNSDSGTGLLLEISKYPDDFVHQRRPQLELVTRRLSGWLVPMQALVFKDGMPGIYVVEKKCIKWLPVTVDDRLDNTVCLSSGALNESLLYVENPGWVREGTRLGSGG